MEYVVLVLFLASISRSLAKSAFEGCSKLNTYGYEYLRFYRPSALGHENEDPTVMLSFEFYVKTGSNALILLTEGYRQGRAYEIVIGGGKNSFSQIRLFPKDPKATMPTKDIVSPVEYRGFWIKLKSLRLLLVGKIGETEPFLFWVNNNPFEVLRIAFSSWNNVKGEWYFDCAKNSGGNPDPAEEEENVTAIYRLKNDLLTLYNPTVIPQREGYPDETIEVHLEATYFHLDEKRGELSLDGMAHVKWMDWKLFWEPAEYDGIDLIHVSPYQIWTPSIRVTNSLALEKRFLLSLSGNVAVTSKGEISWTTPFHSVTLCYLGYKNWPFDKHNCSLVFEFWTEPLKLNVKEVSLAKIYRSEWEIETVNSQELVISRDEFGSIVNISFFRRNPSYEFLLFPPFVGAAVLALISFWLQPNSSIKLFLNCGSILILILILLSMTERVAVVSATPRIVALYSWNVLVMCIPIILFIGLKYIPASIYLPRMLSSLLNSRVIEIVFLLPENPNSQLSYSNLREREEKFISAVRLITLIERLVFFIYFWALVIPFFLFFYNA